MVMEEDQKHQLPDNPQKPVEEEKCDDQLREVRVAILGKQNVGKTTLSSVLLHKKLDDGQGTVRTPLLRHKH